MVYCLVLYFSIMTTVFATEHIPKNISEFCHQTQESYKTQVQEIDLKIIRDIENYKIPFNTFDYEAWPLSLVPHPNYKYTALALDLIRFLDIPDDSLLYDYDDEGDQPIFIQQSISEIIQMSLDYLQKKDVKKVHYQLGEDYENIDPDQSYYNDTLIQIPALCLKQIPMRAKKCTQSLTEITRIMKPVYEMTLIETINEVMKNDQYIDGLINTAIKILKKIQTKSYDHSFIFEDLKASYFKLTGNESQAEKMTWDIMGIISTNGSDTAKYIYEDIEELDGTQDDKKVEYLTQFLISLHTLSAGSVLLDELYLSQGKSSYSYPQHLKNTCQYSKPYHFWMAAYLTNRMSREYKDSLAATHAAWLAQLGYQMRSDTSGRDPSRAFRIKAHSIANDKLRLDLAFSSAGAVYGAQKYNNEKPISKSIDQAIILLKTNAENLEPLSAEKAKNIWNGTGARGYFRWMKIFSPNSVLNYYLD